MYCHSIGWCIFYSEVSFFQSILCQRFLCYLNPRSQAPSLFQHIYIHLRMMYMITWYTGKVPVTVVVDDDVIYMGRENLHQWPLPRLQELPPKEALKPPFSSVEWKDVTDIEQIVSCVYTVCNRDAIIWFATQCLSFMYETP